MAAAQIVANRGDLEGNLVNHRKAIEIVHRHGVQVLVFSEFSMIGYEPDLAQQFQLQPDGVRLADLVESSQRYGMEIIVGAPVRSSGDRQYLASIIFKSDGSTAV